MGTGRFLQKKIELLKLPPSKWIEALEKLSPEEREEIEPFMRQQADILRYRRAMVKKDGAKRV